MTTIKVKNYSLIVFDALNGPHRHLFESYEIARLLGYSQASSLRKQTLTDWKEQMLEDTHYVMVHDAHVIRRYEQEYADAGNGTLKPTSSRRGLLFFTPEGLLHVLNRSSKPSEDLRSALTEAGYLDKVESMVTVAKDVTGINAPRQFITGQPCHRCRRPLDANEDCLCTPAVKVATPKRIPVNTVPATPPPKEERMFEYEVMQRLLEQLERLSEPQLRGLAITAAETALGRELKDLRLGEGVKTIFEAVVQKEAPKTVRQSDIGPLFIGNDFYSMTRIGEKAGNYSARSAGQAANIVAQARGYSPEQIRTEQLPINQIEMRPDSTTGKKRLMVRFSTEFANRCVHELRGNPAFQPMEHTRGVPTLFGAPGVTPLLSRGPFEDDPTPPHHS